MFSNVARPPGVLEIHRNISAYPLFTRMEQNAEAPEKVPKRQEVFQ
jgi:hypothetical protein